MKLFGRLIQAKGNVHGECVMERNTLLQQTLGAIEACKHPSPNDPIEYSIISPWGSLNSRAWGDESRRRPIKNSGYGSTPIVKL